jgi:hypothetical protein
MLWGCLIRISPLDPATGNRVDVYLSSLGGRGEALVNGLGEHRWIPCVTRAPQVGIELWSGDFSVAASPAQANFDVNLTLLRKAYPVDTVMWAGAPIVIYAGNAAASWPWPTVFKGQVNSFEGAFPKLTIGGEVDSEPFSGNILNATYAGTGGAEGGTDLKNTVKPLLIGWCQNVEPVLLDSVKSIYQFSGYGPIEAITVLYERGSDFGASVADYPDYATLAGEVGDMPCCRRVPSRGAGLRRDHRRREGPQGRLDHADPHRGCHRRARDAGGRGHEPDRHGVPHGAERRGALHDRALPRSAGDLRRSGRADGPGL